MIGFYDYTVILTYLGMLFGMSSMMQSANGHFLAAMLCMAGSLFCDTMDGKVARAKRNRTEQEMMFGVQIDSLCDIVSFGLAPAVMFYCLGLDGKWDFLFLGSYCLCSVIRLGYFNVLAEEAEPGKKGDYHGLPVVCLTVMIPMTYLIGLFIPEFLFPWLLRGLLVLFSLLYILDFTVKKPNVWKLLIMCAVFWIPVAIIAAL